jgi:hypothetical protein
VYYVRDPARSIQKSCSMKKLDAKLTNRAAALMDRVAVDLPGAPPFQFSPEHLLACRLEGTCGRHRMSLDVANHGTVTFYFETEAERHDAFETLRAACSEQAARFSDANGERQT